MAKKALIFYKKSAFSIYFQDPESSFRKGKKIDSSEFLKFKSMHETHQQSLLCVERILKSFHFKTKRMARGRSFHASDYDLVVTVGGDGTFLEASHNIQSQLILGVNSDPSRSVGRFCSADIKNFAQIVEGFLYGKSKVFEYPRLEVVLPHVRTCFLNDILVCHSNPAAMSRYVITIDHQSEEQKSSGIWISTAAGSSGANQSAGGRRFPPTRRLIQYRPRELYANKATPYRLKGGVLSIEQDLMVTSMMREGVMFVDGSHMSFSFEYGVQLKIKPFKYPLRVLS
ncbi:MAG: NAD(+)/NADH kinase [Candidatus Omnitrophica bacterium]|nr:NAD(+)/NADH kinase [Candidatus Omnitrophota bacterium]